MSTAICIYSESSDKYLYCLEGFLSDEEAMDEAEKYCPEEREYWGEVIISRTGEHQ